jgi:hypothetical protein
MDEDDAIPIVEVYRGVGIEDQQSFERIRFVKSEIDRVHRLSGADDLFAYASNPQNPPEPRMLAGARAEALCELAAEERRPRAISLERLRAATAGLGSKTWRDPYSHCSLLDQPGPGAAGAVAREQPLADLLE